MPIIGSVAQVIVALGILNVWLLRYGKATPYRGGEAKNMREEFAAYGLPFWFMCVIGVLKVGLAVTLLVGLWLPAVVVPAAAGMGALMAGAVAMHFKAGDPVKKALPAMSVLALCVVAALF